jgi:ferrochelatase
VRTAVVLFNLGGPDRPEAVRPFLFNLFNDKAIIALPQPFRWAIARLISGTRAKAARANYAIMGGASPLLKETRAQVDALEGALATRLDGEVRTFIAMRYWNPMTAETARAVEAYAPDQVILLPLYPHYSTTTTGSSLEAWNAVYHGPGQVHAVCCYPQESGLIEAHARSIQATHRALGQPGPLRVLFSAHGLPQKVVDGGDPYQDQIERTAAAVVARLGPTWAADWDWRLCYQSRVGPMKWLGPSTPEAIADAAKDGRGVLVVPIAFVSEHVETLVELDHDYARHATGRGVTTYVRAPALGVQQAFVEGLAAITARALHRDGGVEPAGPWHCGGAFTGCPARAERAI